MLVCFGEENDMQWKVCESMLRNQMVEAASFETVDCVAYLDGIRQHIVTNSSTNEK